MNADELKAACERAGIPWAENVGALNLSGPYSSSGVLHWSTDEARAYVAERLTALVRESNETLADERLMPLRFHAALRSLTSPGQVSIATAEQRIKAALAVLP